MPRLIRLAAALVVVAASFGAQPLAAQQKIETDGAYVHAAAHAVFPLRVGDFIRSDVYQYDQEGRDVSASYNLATPKGRLLITVYVYPASEAAAGAAESREASRTRLCDEEFVGVKAAIANSHEGAAPVEERAALAVRGVADRLSHRAIYRYPTLFGDRVQEIISEAHLYCYVGGTWLVKYRVSTPAAVEARGPVDAFIRSGPWPGRAPAAIARAD